MNFSYGEVMCYTLLEILLTIMRLGLAYSTPLVGVVH